MGIGKQSEAERHDCCQTGEDLLILVACSFACIRPHKPFGLSFDQQIEERGGTGSHKEDQHH